MRNQNELAGKNRFEMLVFGIGGRNFGINVFKVREIINFQKINEMPGGHDNVMGIISIRGQVMPVVNMAKTLNIRNADNPEVSPEENSEAENNGATEDKIRTNNSGFFIVTEYNRTVQALKIDSVSKIENVSWEDVSLPPSGSGKNSYLTSVVNIDNEMIQILDVEKILLEIEGDEDKYQNAIESDDGAGKKILVVDDSKVAQKQLGRALEKLGFEIDYKSDGKEALEHIVSLSETTDISKHYAAVVSDIEMPRMDGYTLVAELRGKGFSDLNIIMHTSMSGVFNKAMVDKVGANDFIPKFDAKEIQDSLLKLTNPKNESRLAA